MNILKKIFIKLFYKFNCKIKYNDLEYVSSTLKWLKENPEFGKPSEFLNDSSPYLYNKKTFLKSKL